MARVGRLAGALLAETQGEFYLVGHTKMPCDWAHQGFEKPVESDAQKLTYRRLSRSGPATVAPPYLTLELEGELLAQKLAELLVVERTGLVSERLWRLVTGMGEDQTEPDYHEMPARWLGEIPNQVWQVVREAVLRCS